MGQRGHKRTDDPSGVKRKKIGGDGDDDVNDHRLAFKCSRDST